MYTTTKQCVHALRSGRITTTGDINRIILGYNGADVTFYAGQQVVMSPDCDVDHDIAVCVGDAIVYNGDLYISLEDVDGAVDHEGIFTGKMKDLQKVMSDRVLGMWRFGATMDKLSQEDPMIEGIVVFTDNNMLYAY